MSMKQTLLIMFTPIRLQKLAPRCRTDAFPLLCQRKVIEQIEKEYNYTDLDEYDFSGSGDYYIDYDYEPTSEEEFAQYLIIFFFPYLLLFGTIGNIFSVVLLRRYSFDIWSTCLYTTVLFPMDLIKLYVNCGNDWYKHVHKDGQNLSMEILIISNAVCKVYSFTYTLLVHESEWLMVAVGVETAIATRSPMLIYEMCTRERGTAIILFISVLLICLNLHYFWTTGLTRPDAEQAIDRKMCVYINELSDQFRDYIWPVINFLIGQVIPFLLVATAIFVVCVKLVDRPSDEREQNKRLEKYFLDVQTLKELRKAMFLVCIVGLLSLLCGIIETGLMYFATKQMIVMSYETNRLVRTILVTFRYFFLSHKFWIFYFMCAKFRKDVKNLLKSFCRPLTSMCRRSHTRSNTLLGQTYQQGQSWHTNRIPLSDDSETM